jgi:hypothetical protein
MNNNSGLGSCINKFASNIKSALLIKYDSIKIKYCNMFLDEITKNAQIGKFETHININSEEFNIFNKLTTNLQNWDDTEIIINRLVKKWIEDEDAKLYELDYKTYKINDILFIQL